MASAKTPVTLITGYLGAGKTTLVNRLVKDAAIGPAGPSRIGVIVNEFGEVGIDGALIAESAGSERVYELANGCLCCVLTGEFQKTLARAAEAGFDRLIVETSGAADPTSVIRMLWGAPELTARFRLDGVICVVDARAFARTTEADPVALLQASVADVALLSKIESAGAASVDEARALIASLNPAATIVEHDFCREDPLDSRRFLALDAYRRLGPAFLKVPEATRSHQGLSSVAVSWEGAVARAELQAFFRELARDERIVRTKAILHVEGEERPWLIQGVQSWLERGPAPRRYAGPNRLVILGRLLDTEGLRSAIDRLRK